MYLVGFMQIRILQRGDIQAAKRISTKQKIFLQNLVMEIPHEDATILPIFTQAGMAMENLLVARMG